MDDLVETVNETWEEAEAIPLAAYCLWRLNWIHPFFNGNGRTARALCYYVISVKLGMRLPGSPILPGLILSQRDDYVKALKDADSHDGEDLTALCNLVSDLLTKQLQSVA